MEKRKDENFHYGFDITPYISDDEQNYNLYYPRKKDF